MIATEDLEFVLPGEWWSLDLRGDVDTVTKRISSLSARAVGRQDDRARARHLVRVSLEKAANYGHTLRAEQVHIARTVIGAVPISAILAISRPGISLPPDGTIEAQAGALREIVPGREPTVLEHQHFAVVRSLDVAEQGAYGDGISRLPRLTANYWIQLPGTGHLVIFTFTSPMITLQQELLLLFDAITSTVQLRPGQIVVPVGGADTIQAMPSVTQPRRVNI